MRYLILLYSLLFTSVCFGATTHHITLLEQELRTALVENDSKKARILRSAIAERRDWYAERPTIEYGKYIIVNVGAQRVRLVEHNRIKFDEKVVVGKPGMETPLFDDEIIDIVVNPVWNIPPDLAENMLPKMKEVGGWNGYKIYVDGELVDSVYDVQPGMNYRIVQDPSETNALGTLKFNLPNPYGVYLHDTSMRHLFDEHNRQFSAGCVRVQNAELLASKLLKWEPDAVFTAIEEQTTYSVPLPNPVKVFIVDWAVHFDGDGQIVYKKNSAT